ncbi:MAG: UDP-N-acetylmuramate dehydrogenase, partial [Deltaproteobacteria bacterium]|nr:UDP-N-acetylmuramate dehydrogenase [Deltaproteobacteria bacterium]
MSSIPQFVAQAPLTTTMGVGGPAEWLARVTSVAEAVQALDFAEQHGLQWFVVGGGSNVVIADRGLAGVVLHPALPDVPIAVLGDDGERVLLRVAAGLDWDELVAWSVEQGLQGIECLSGIPGQVGAAPVQNIGAYGQEVAEVLLAVHGVDVAAKAARTWTAAECQLSYRDSVFKQNPQLAVVLAVDLQLWRGRPACLAYAQVQQAAAGVDVEGPQGLARVRELVLQLRADKGMVVRPDDPDSRSCGSFFTNPIVDLAFAEQVRARLAPGGAMPMWPYGTGQVKLSAAWLIEKSGLHKGFGEGRVGLSTKHTLAIVNRGGATAKEVLDFAELVVRRVQAASGVGLVAEV